MQMVYCMLTCMCHVTLLCFLFVMTGQGRIQHVIITGGCTVILAHAQVVGGGAVRTLVP